MKNKVQVMGVMNVTPNSFSDGGKFQKTAAIEKQIESFEKLGVTLLDIGAESTAPMNQPISSHEEWQRLGNILEILLRRKWQGIVSLDSYRPGTAFQFFEALKHGGYENKQFLWNDVSGVWDKEVEGFLNTFEGSRYVFCHNECSGREQTSHHMEYRIETSNIIGRVADFLNGADLEKYGRRVLLDPCFGFSKDYGQNWALIDGFRDFLGLLGGHDVIFGVSRKFFLRKWWQEHMEGEESHRESLLEKSEILHCTLIRDLYQRLPEEYFKNLIFRVHNPEIPIAALR